MFHFLPQAVQSSGPRQDSEGRPGVVSDAMLTARGLATQRRVELAGAPGFVSCGPIPEPIVKKVAQAQNRHGNPMGSVRLIHLICHLIC